MLWKNQLFGLLIIKPFYTSLYPTYVRPILQYAPPAWSPYLKGNIDHVESVQHYFTRRLLDRCGMEYVERLNFLQLDSLEVRRIKADLILYYKVINNLIQIDTANSIRHKHSFRGHNLNLYTFYCRTEIRKYFWCNRLVSPWNSLYCSIVNAASLCQFKKLWRCATQW